MAQLPPTIVSRYEMFLRNDEGLPKSDLTLVVWSVEKERKVDVHSQFLWQCGLIRGALSAPMQEGTDWIVRMHDPTDALDGLLQFVYDGFLGHKCDVAALYLLADYAQCESLRRLIIDGLTKATWPKGDDLTKDSFLRAMAAPRVKELADAMMAFVMKDKDVWEQWLDDENERGALLGAVVDYAFDNAVAYFFLAEYIAEVRRKDLARLPPRTFGTIMCRVETGSISEQEHAGILLNYLDDRRPSTSTAAVILSLVHWPHMPQAVVERFLDRVHTHAPVLALSIATDCTWDEDHLVEPPIRCLISGQVRDPDGLDAVFNGYAAICTDTDEFPDLKPTLRKFFPGADVPGEADPLTYKLRDRLEDYIEKKQKRAEIASDFFHELQDEEIPAPEEARPAVDDHTSLPKQKKPRLLPLTYSSIHSEGSRAPIFFRGAVIQPSLGIVGPDVVRIVNLDDRVDRTLDDIETTIFNEKQKCDDGQLCRCCAYIYGGDNIVLGPLRDAPVRKFCIATDHDHTATMNCYNRTWRDIGLTPAGATIHVAYVAWGGLYMADLR